MKKITKKIIKQRNPSLLTEIINLVDQKVMVHSRFSVIAGILESRSPELFNITIPNASLYFKLKNIKIIDGKNIFLEDIDY